mmetsp:Transcript_18074/g.59375  ORF Transcript_18074/g.59375 Transcript_18074/m.59375 type:complete len:232 (+) Transcript_18074:264-959(+)
MPLSSPKDVPRRRAQYPSDAQTNAGKGPDDEVLVLQLLSALLIIHLRLSLLCLPYQVTVHHHDLHVLRVDDVKQKVFHKRVTPELFVHIPHVLFVQLQHDLRHVHRVLMVGDHLPHEGGYRVVGMSDPHVVVHVTVHPLHAPLEGRCRTAQGLRLALPYELGRAIVVPVLRSWGCPAHFIVPAQHRRAVQHDVLLILTWGSVRVDDDDFAAHPSVDVAEVVDLRRCFILDP